MPLVGRKVNSHPFTWPYTNSMDDPLSNIDTSLDLLLLSPLHSLEVTCTLHIHMVTGSIPAFNTSTVSAVSANNNNNEMPIEIQFCRLRLLRSAKLQFTFFNDVIIKVWGLGSF